MSTKDEHENAPAEPGGIVESERLADIWADFEANIKPQLMDGKNCFAKNMDFESQPLEDPKVCKVFFEIHRNRFKCKFCGHALNGNGSNKKGYYMLRCPNPTCRKNFILRSLADELRGRKRARIELANPSVEEKKKL